MPSLKKNFFYSALLTVANYVFPLITYPYVSRVLGVTGIGVCNFVDNIINWFIVFSTMGISVLGVREIAAVREDRAGRDSVFSSLLALSGASTLLAALVLLGAIFVIPSLQPYRNLLFIGVAKLVFHSLNLEWFFRGAEEFKFITNRTVLIKMLYVAAIFLFVRTPGDYPVYYLLLTLTIVVNTLVNIVYARNFVSLKLSGIQLGRYAAPFFLLGMNYVLTSVYTSCNVIYLGFVSGTEQVGYYTSATKIITLVTAMFSAFTTVLLPRMSAVLSEGKTDEFKLYVSRTFSILFLVGIPLVILLEIGAADVIRVISGPGYEGAVVPMMIVAPLAVIIGLEQILIIQILMPQKRDRQILINSGAGALVAVVVNLLLVRMLKAFGSAIVWLCAELTVFLFALNAVFGKAWEEFPWRTLLKDLLLYIPLALILVAIQWIPFPNAFVRLFADCAVVGVYFALLTCLVVRDPVILGLVNPLVQRFAPKQHGDQENR